MSKMTRSNLTRTLVACWCLLVATSLQSSVRCQQRQQNVELQGNFPYYIQSPMAPETQPAQEEQTLTQRSLINMRPVSIGRKLNGTSEVFLDPVEPKLQQQQQQPPVQITQPPKQERAQCLYDKRYFNKLDECLARKPYPTVGLLAFKNEDLLVKRGVSDKHGCVFILNSGLFKNYQLTKYSVDSDSQCLDGTKVELSMAFNNVTLSYLWSLRCLNRADQLLDDATLEGKTSYSSSPSDTNHQDGVCVGSSQNFGFTSLQLSGVEAQIELASDIYKNWRVININMAMTTPKRPVSSARATGDHLEEEILNSNINDFTFESLDGDELNWRNLHLFQNWSRNRIHANFIAQYRRFLWISLQRCLHESSEKLPIKLVDLFSNQKLE